MEQVRLPRLLSLTEPPTAVFAHSDEVAAGAIRTLRRTDLPEDISIVGIDDHPLADYLDLTTVRQDPHLQGVRGARQLIRRLAGEPSDPEIVSTELVVRRSTSPPRRRVGADLSRRRPTQPLDQFRNLLSQPVTVGGEAPPTLLDQQQSELRGDEGAQRVNGSTRS